MPEQLTRSQVPVELTWNLADIIADQTAYEEAVTNVKAAIAALPALADHFTDDAEHLAAGLRTYYAALQQLDRVSLYAHLSQAQDTTDANALKMVMTVQQLDTDFTSATVWVDPSIIALDQAQLDQWLAADEDLAQFSQVLANVRTRVGHVLSEKEEQLLAAFGPTIGAAEEVQTTLDDADLTYGEIDYAGKVQALTKALRGQIMENADRDTRKQAAKQFNTAYVDHENTFAQTLQGHIHAQNTLAKVRHFDSARQMDLSENQIPESVYDTLIEEAHKHVDIQHRFNALRKRVLGLDVMYGYDMALPLTGGKPPFAPTYEEAKATVLKGLAPLGEDYLAHLQDEFDHRWIDVLETKGKTSGGFQTGTYGVHPYVLLNWADTYTTMSTLAHESGHAMQTVYSNANQTYWDAQYPIFTAEVASTTNESLLNAYMLDQTKDDREKQIYLLTTEVEDFMGTFFAQAEFAEFEQFMYETEASGTPLTPETLTEKWETMGAEYSGPAVTPTPWKKANWAQIPHFFYNYYMYQYATSKAIATALAKRILTEGEPAVAAYKQFLAAGNSDTPVNVLKEAGIDVTKPDYLEDAFTYISTRLDELEALLLK